MSILQQPVLFAATQTDSLLGFWLILAVGAVLLFGLALVLTTYRLRGHWLSISRAPRRAARRPALPDVLCSSNAGFTAAPGALIATAE